MRRGWSLPGPPADGSVRRVAGRLRGAARGSAAGPQRAEGLAYLVQGRSAVLSVVVNSNGIREQKPAIDTVGTVRPCLGVGRVDDSPANR